MASFTVGAITCASSPVSVYYNTPPGGPYFISSGTTAAMWGGSFTVSLFPKENPAHKDWRRIFDKIDAMDRQKQKKGGAQ